MRDCLSLYLIFGICEREIDTIRNPSDYERNRMQRVVMNTVDVDEYTKIRGYTKVDCESADLSCLEKVGFPAHSYYFLSINWTVKELRKYSSDYQKPCDQAKDTLQKIAKERGYQTSAISEELRKYFYFESWNGSEIDNDVARFDGNVYSRYSNDIMHRYPAYDEGVCIPLYSENNHHRDYRIYDAITLTMVIHVIPKSSNIGSGSITTEIKKPSSDLSASQASTPVDSASSGRYLTARSVDGSKPAPVITTTPPKPYVPQKFHQPKLPPVSTSVVRDVNTVGYQPDEATARAKVAQYSANDNVCQPKPGEVGFAVTRAVENIVCRPSQPGLSLITCQFTFVCTRTGRGAGVYSRKPPSKASQQ